MGGFFPSNQLLVGANRELIGGDCRHEVLDFPSSLSGILPLAFYLASCHFIGDV
jgi:hypothetical protein